MMMRPVYFILLLSSLFVDSLTRAHPPCPIYFSSEKGSIVGQAEDDGRGLSDYHRSPYCIQSGFVAQNPDGVAGSSGDCPEGETGCGDSAVASDLSGKSDTCDRDIGAEAKGGRVARVEDVFYGLSDKWLSLVDHYKHLLEACRCYGVWNQIPPDKTIRVQELYNQRCPLHVREGKPVMFHASEERSLESLREEIKPLGDGIKGKGFYVAMNPLYCLSYIMSRLIQKVSPEKNLDMCKIIEMVNGWMLGERSVQDVEEYYKVDSGACHKLTAGDKPVLLVLSFGEPHKYRVRKERGAERSHHVIQIDPAYSANGETREYAYARYLLKPKLFTRTKPVAIEDYISLPMLKTGHSL